MRSALPVIIWQKDYKPDSVSEALWIVPDAVVINLLPLLPLQWFYFPCHGILNMRHRNISI